MHPWEGPCPVGTVSKRHELLQVLPLHQPERLPHSLKVKAKALTCLHDLPLPSLPSDLTSFHSPSLISSNYSGLPPPP